jgi:hypothetical protein
MSTPIETQCAEAMARITSHINRSAGQHARAIKRAFVAAQNRVHGTESIGYERTAAQDPTPAQQAAWKRLHGYAGIPLAEPVESTLRAEAAQQLHRVDASQMQPTTQATVRHHTHAAEQEPVDLWPVIRRIYMVLGAVGVLGVAAVMWGA